MKKEITLGFTTEQKLFRAYVELLQPIFKLRNREADVFAQLLYFNYLKRDIKNINDRFELILSPKNKKQILENLNIGDNILQNMLSNLRKKGLLVDNIVPVKYHQHIMDNSLDLIFKLRWKK